MKKPWTDRAGDFMAGKGFYIVLFLCVAAIGISGYYLFSSLAGDGGDAPVSATAQVVVTPPPGASPPASPSPQVTPVKPSVNPDKPTSGGDRSAASELKPSPTASAAPSPSPSSTPAVATTAGVFTWPVKGQIVDAYSPDKQRLDVTMGDWRTHSGIDIAAEAGTQVKAASSGVVERIQSDDLLGTTLTIDHGNGVKSCYSNLGELPTVSEGDNVAAGEIIGAIGSTAKGESAQVSHLHLAFLDNEVPSDPLAYLPTQS